MHFRRLVLFCFGLVLGIFSVYGRSNNDSTKVNFKYLVNLRAAYPMPLSGATFNRIYSGITSVEVSAQRVAWKKLCWGPGFDYMLFQTSSKVLDVKSYMQVYSPFVSACLRCKLKRFLFTPFVNAGYAFILFTGVDADGNAKPAFHQSGTFFKTGLNIGYSLNERIDFGLTGAWASVLQHFGNSAAYENNIISIVTSGAYVTYKF